MPECIHGLEAPLCDLCYPQVQPERPRLVRSTGPRTVRVSGAPSPRKSISSAQQRVYHVTHLRNLEVILDSGQLSAQASPPVDLSAELARELRRSAEVAPGLSVAEHVAFYLSPEATLWQQLREGAHDRSRWSDAARAAAPAEFVFIVTTVQALGESAVISDADAAASLARFASGEGLPRMLEHLHDTQGAADAEALVRQSLPIESVQLIGVANDRVRAVVKELTSIKVAVYPPWFQLAQ